MKGSKKVVPNKYKVPEQDPKERVKNFNEVPYGYTEDLAIKEAKRCLQCDKPTCIAGCPVAVDIPGFIDLIAKKDFLGAAKKIKETNLLPAMCGRVCPQEDQCQKVCILGKKYEPVAIGALERFAADFERKNGRAETPKMEHKKNKKVAVVGSGPAGLTCAGELVRNGYDVTVFEALHKPGGVLVYGIPEFRLPKAIVDWEIDYLKKLGIKLEPNVVVGRTVTVDELLKDGFGAVFIGLGAGAPNFMNIPGENLCGIYSANEYLTRSNLMKAYLFPEYDTPIVRGKKVAVIGGGNVAMDSARTALRLGAKTVHIVYRRSRKEMPARIEEIHHGEEEGVKFHFLILPLKYIGDEKGFVQTMEAQKMELGEPDSSGRRRPVPIPGSEFTLEVDLVIVAIGTSAQPLIASTNPDLELNKWGYIEVDESTGATSKKKVWAGGDIVTGSATVISAMGGGKKSAAAIAESLR